MLRVADPRRQPAARRITLAGLPATVVPSRANDVGLIVRTEAEDHLDAEWQLRKESDLVLLRQLVAAGQVTIDDDEDPFRLGEWNGLLADTSRGCFLVGCKRTDMDERGPVHDDKGRIHKACTGHWEAIHGLIGADRSAEQDAKE